MSHFVSRRRTWTENLNGDEENRIDEGRAVSMGDEPEAVFVEDDGNLATGRRREQREQAEVDAAAV